MTLEIVGGVVLVTMIASLTYLAETVDKFLFGYGLLGLIAVVMAIVIYSVHRS